MNINALPNGILLEIFGLLTTDELFNGSYEVCTHWRNIIELMCFRISTVNDLKRLANGYFYLRSMEITTEVNLTMFLEGLGCLHSNLKEIKIHNCNIVDNGHLRQISEYFPKLKHVDLFLKSDLIDAGFIDSFKNVNNLILNHRLTDSSLIDISKVCRNLRELHMYGSLLFYQPYQLQIFLIDKGIYLNKLTLRCPEFSDRLCKTFSNCSNLIELRLYHCWLMTATGLLEIANIKRLKTLHITGLKLVKRSGMSEFLDKLSGSQLNEVNFSSSEFSDEHVDPLSKCSANVRILELWKCRLSENGIRSIAQKFTKLHTLDLDAGLSSDCLVDLSNSSNIEMLRFNITKEIDSAKLALHFKIYDCYSCKGEYFRGNGEGFRANLMSYSLLNHNLYNL